MLKVGGPVGSSGGEVDETGGPGGGESKLSSGASLTGDCLGNETFVKVFEVGLSTKSGVSRFILRLEGNSSSKPECIGRV